MSVKIFVRVDAQGRELPASKGHESWGAYELIRRLWQDLAVQSTHYAIGINLKEPSADVVILSERGLGIVELKDVPGKIYETGTGYWAFEYATGSKIIKAGNEKRKNPHVQVHDYAERIRGKSRKFFREHLSRQSDTLVFNTAVCFTHPTAEIALIQKTYQSRYRPPEYLERFQIMTPEDILKMVYSLNFEGRDDQPSYLQSIQVNAFFENLFGMKESEEISGAMKSSGPVGYVSVMEGDYPLQSYSLYHGDNQIGRDPNSSVPIPLDYPAVSRNHARIVIGGGRIGIQDLGSRYGTLLEGKGVSTETPQALKDGQLITLCRPEKVSQPCVLKFHLDEQKTPSTIIYSEENSS